MADHRTLRPLERCVLRLVDDGIDEAEIGRRFRRRPEFVKRVIAYTRIPRTGVAVRTAVRFFAARSTYDRDPPTTVRQVGDPLTVSAPWLARKVNR